MSIDDLLEDIFRAGQEAEKYDIEAENVDLKELKSSLLKIVLEALPEKRTETIELGSFYPNQLDELEKQALARVMEQQSYNKALDDVRQRIEEVFK